MWLFLLFTLSISPIQSSVIRLSWLFYREDILSSPIAILERVDVILLETYKTIETAVEKSFEVDLVNQSSKVDDNEAFLHENLKFKDENKSNKDN